MPSVGRVRYLEALPPPSASRRDRGALILIHGFPLNARMWEPQLALAEGGWRVIAPHLRGMDAAPGGPTAATLDDFAADIVDLMDALHIENAVIGGLSMGGYTAFALLRLAARYFRGLILADTRSEADTVEGVAARKRMIQLVGEKGPLAVVDEMMPKLLGTTTRENRPELVDQVRSLALASSSEALAGAIRAMMGRPDSTPLLSTIHVPTLVLVGEEDGLTPVENARDLHRQIPGSDLRLIPMAGHLSNLEQPEAFNDAVGHFLSRRV
ncbi:MAG TPA: alpha/beta fold hydrolase [Vicinamibacterales bacterium]|jgi:3-oxoadipate enol-lactonase|nr:alpha/beta fold hydrolase [Vicinamibacterales bacterium]